MKKMIIYEPAMCCSTGICGVSVNPELIRISGILDSLKRNGIEVKRFNLSNDPIEFMINKNVNNLISKENGLENLPCTIVENEIVIMGRYPTNEEVAELLGIDIGIMKK